MAVADPANDQLRTGMNGPPMSDGKYGPSTDGAGTTQPSADGYVLLPGDKPSWKDLPADVLARLRRTRRDPSDVKPPVIIQQTSTITVGNPTKDDVFRTHFDQEEGWLDVTILTLKKGFGQAGGKKTFIVVADALENPAVRQRARVGKAILITTSEGVHHIWIISVPDPIQAPGAYPYDVIKWTCATAAMTSWVQLAWNDDTNIHEWEAVDLTDEPNDVPVWPTEPMGLIFDRSLFVVTIDRRDHPELKNLSCKKAR
jgi:hypothetical protein